MKNILFLLFLFAVGTLSAQLTKENQAGLGKELLRLINEERTQKKLGALQADAKLKTAAETHSLYMARKKVLTHTETGAAKEPVNRVARAKGTEFDYIGENILSVPAPAFPLKNQDLKALAKTLFEQWKSSPPHYANILHGEYTFCDFGFALDKKSGVLYATNVFARKGSQIPGQLSKNAFGLQQGPAYECNLLMSNKENVAINLGNCLSVQNEKVVFFYHDIEEIKALLDQPNDGFAIDVLLPEQMACGSPNQIDVSPIYDGILLKPVYRDALFASNEAQGAYRLITTLGELPPACSGKNVSLSLIIIQNGKVCSYEYPVRIYHDSYELTPIEPVLLHEANTDLLEEGIAYSVEIPFDFGRNITRSSVPEMPKLEGTLYAIDIASFSSVEGRTADNVKLQNSRAEFILEELHKHYSFKDNIVHTTTMENWPKMRFQLKYFGLDAETGTSEDAIKTFLATNQSAFRDSLLFEQRRSYAVLHFIGKTDKSRTMEKTAAMMLLETSVFHALKTNPTLVLNAAALLLKDPQAMLYPCTEFLDTWIGRYDELSPDAQKNLLHLYTHVSRNLLDLWDVPSQRLARVIRPELLSDKVTGMNDRSLLLNFHLSAIDYYGQINASGLIEQSFVFIRDHFNKADLSAEQRTKLALFYNNWSQYQLTNEFLFQHIDDTDFSEDEAILLMGTAFALQENFTQEQITHIMERAFNLNPQRWCAYVADNFQLRRNGFIKDKVCSYCGDE